MKAREEWIISIERAASLDAARPMASYEHMQRLLLAGIAGFFVGLLIFAVTREVYFAFSERDPIMLVNASLRAVGSLSWVDTTLVTGVAAVLAAAFSIREVRKQIRSTEIAAEKQIDHASRLHAEIRDSKRDAARSSLPLALSSICEYSEICTRQLAGILPHVREGRVPRSFKYPDFPRLPDNAISAIKETIEFIDEADRKTFARLISRIQVQHSRIRGLPDESRATSGVSRVNLDAYIIDSAIVYAQASELFDFARYDTDVVPDQISDEALGSAFSVAQIYGSLKDRLMERAQRRVSSP